MDRDGLAIYRSVHQLNLLLPRSSLHRSEPPSSTRRAIPEALGRTKLARCGGSWVRNIRRIHVLATMLPWGVNQPNVFALCPIRHCLTTLFPLQCPHLTRSPDLLMQLACLRKAKKRADHKKEETKTSLKLPVVKKTPALGGSSLRPKALGPILKWMKPSHASKLAWCITRF